MNEFLIPLDDIDPESLDKGFGAPKPGKYHVRVLAIQQQDVPRPTLIVDCEILAGTVADQEGKRQRIWLELTGDTPERAAAARRRLLVFALACKLVSQEDLQKSKAAGTPLQVDWGMAVGRHLYIEITTYEKKNGEHGLKVGWGMWAIDSPKVDGLPKHPAYSYGLQSNEDVFGDVPF